MAYEWFMYTFIIVSVVGVFTYFIYDILRNKYRVRVRELVKGRKIIKDYRARYYEDKDKISWWKLAGERNKNKKLIPLPPEEAIELNQKGKKVVECYRTEGGDIIWAAERGEIGAFPEELLDKPPTKELKEFKKMVDSIGDEKLKSEKFDEYTKRVEEHWIKQTKIIKPFQPLTTKQRMIYVQNLRKTESRKGMTWQQVVIPAVSLGVLGLVLIAGMIFWGDLAKPAISANEQAITMATINKENLELLKELKTGVQRIEDKVNSLPSSVPD